MVPAAAETSAQALSAIGTSLSATAHNIANASTPGFAPVRAELADGPGGQGVQVAAVRPAGQGLPAEAVTGAGALSAAPGVDLTRELTGLLSGARAFEANAAMLRAAEETTGHLLNIVV